MILKKILLSLTTIFLLGLGNAYAATQAPISNAPRFIEIRNDGMSVDQFDTATLQYEKDCYSDELLLSAWIKTLNTNRSDYNLYHYLFRQKNREFMLLDQIHVNSSGTIIRKTSTAYDPNSWTQIVPETDPEKWYSSVIKYAQTNDKKLKKQYKNRKTDYNQKSTDDGFLEYFSGIPLFQK